MNRQLTEVTSRAKAINPEFTLCDQWVKRVANLHDAKPFLRQISRVLDAEQTGAFFKPRHYKKSNPEKLALTYKHCRLISELIGRVFTDRLELSGQTGALGPVSESNIQQITRTVSTDGIATLPIRLNDKNVSTILGTLEGLNFESRISKQVKSGIDGNSNLEGAWWLSDTSSFAGIQEVQDLAFEPTILQIVQGVLGTMPIHVQSNAWWTFPLAGVPGDTLERAQKRDAQWFHQDMEFIDFVKVFVYLSDVDMSNGPHVYVRGSADDYEERLPGIQVSRRVSDEEISSAFGPDRIASNTGPAGTILIANTRGYHKGAPVISGHRLLLQFEYTCSMYFNPVVSFPADCLTEGTRNLATHAPRMFMNYRDASIEPEVTGWRTMLNRFSNSLPFRSSSAKRAA
jgi:hypothetical protein